MTKSLVMSPLVLLLSAKSTGAFSSGWEYREARNCTSIIDIICDNDNLSTDTLCQAIKLAGLEDDFDTETWTLFAPINTAFDALPEIVVSELLDGDDTRPLTDLIAFHTVPEQTIVSTDLKCDSRSFMANEEFTFTICEGDKTFQVGQENPIANYPQIISSDIMACNGVIHTLSEVMLFKQYNDMNSTNVDPALSTTSVTSNVPSDGPSLEPSSSPSSVPSDGPSLEPSFNPSSVPSDGPSLLFSITPSFVPSDGPSLQPSLGPTLSPSSVPSDGPSLEPSISPSSVPSDGPSLEPSISPSSAPSDGPSLQPSTAPSAAPSEGPPLQPSLEASFSNVPSDGPSLQPSGAPSKSGPQPCTITEIVCDLKIFTQLCALHASTGLDEFFNQRGGNITLFAPTDEAFENLDPVAMEYLLDGSNVKLLTSILLFHTVGDTVITSEDLQCSKKIRMDNGRKSRTVCRNTTVAQKGPGNSEFNTPTIIEPDIQSCSGVIHVIDEVMLYKTLERLGIPSKNAILPSTLAPTLAPTAVPTAVPPTIQQGNSPGESESCKTIDKLVCATPDFSVLCNSLHKTGLWNALSTGTWTLLAPTNEAFLRLPPADVETLTSDAISLSKLLMFHVVPREALYKHDLPCSAGQNLLPMANGKDTRTLCENHVPKWQKGKYNVDTDLPEYVVFDLEACNGVVHGLDGVMLYRPISEL
eukprot:CAMPEP_0172379388 /NCGR_PEP_ID=MMETSP1060-20121228/69907_1 /TAXON_ID=37318 /ORGANISM="Pseudo-nitzschia pungens, Strain cf. cingulata" /LENGTH=698 /DNA_ID=CAMNT_0013107129 /DNA_START=102 /DNA_END=2198 /DNA_ORIENTATION=+